MIQADPTILIPLIAGAMGTMAGAGWSAYRAVKKVFNGSDKIIAQIQSTQNGKFEEIIEGQDEIRETLNQFKLQLYGFRRDIQEINTHGCRRFILHTEASKVPPE